MRVSNDRDGSEATNLCSLGVVDLDLSVSPYVFGLRAFDESLPITRMLPGASPCELRFLLPDSTIGKEGFHDVLVQNLTASSTWRSRHVSPSDVMALRRRWPKATFQVMKEQGTEMERLQRQAYQRPAWAYRHAKPGYCPRCKTLTESSLEFHMMCFHLELGNSGAAQSSGAQYGKAPSKSAGNISMINMVNQRPWTLGVCRDCSLHGQFHVNYGKWHFSRKCRSLQWMCDYSTRRQHKYRVYKDPLPHPALRGGGGGVIPKLLSFVGRAMAIAQLTQLRISIPSSGAPPGEVPADCFPSADSSAVTIAPRRVTFAPDIPTPMEDTQLQLTDTDLHQPTGA